MLQTKDIDKTYQKHFIGSEVSMDEFEIKEGPLHMLGRIILSPITGTAKIVRAFAELFMREDADDVEYIDNKETTDEESTENK